MSEAPIRAASNSRKVLCPECGALFSARGLQGHRRLSHGVAVGRAEGEEPSSLVRTKQAQETFDYLPQFVRAFDELLGLLRRLETRLERLEQARPDLLTAVRLQQASDAKAVEQSLRSVLDEIARIESRSRELCVGPGPNEKSSEALELEKTHFLELGKLRRRQASLLFRLRELQGEDYSDEALCS
jgi:hypothetical protein